MPLETFSFISSFNVNNPIGGDDVSVGQAHIRGVKLGTQQSFPNIDGPVTANVADLNLLAGAAANGSGLALPAFIQMYAGAAAPTGWLLCDGGAIAGGFTDLIAIVGANTPDLRGMFIRGSSDDNSVDPDGPRAAGTVQAEDFKAHTHDSSADSIPGASADGDPGGDPKAEPGIATASAGGDETRPINYAVTYIIKT